MTLEDGRTERPAAGLGVDVTYATIGFTPIVALALSLIEVVPLHRGAPLLLGGAAIVGASMAACNRACRRTVLQGLAAGVLAVLLYDGTRLPFVVLGGWPDFIPMIGVWLFQDPDTHWSVGYLWRYLGNGGGMGLAFMLLAPYTHRWIDPRRAGLLYGVAVWSGLLATHRLAPNADVDLFVLSPMVLVLSLAGHLVYGSVLGYCSYRQAVSQPAGAVMWAPTAVGSATGRPPRADWCRCDPGSRSLRSTTPDRRGERRRSRP